MRKRVLVFVAIAFGVVNAGVAAQYSLSVSGSGVSGTKLVFTTSGPPSSVNMVSFLGISPLQGTTEFPIATIDLGYPILAYGMGSLKDGVSDRSLLVPSLPANFLMTWYAQSLVVTPRGGGYQVTKTGVTPFVIQGK